MKRLDWSFGGTDSPVVILALVRRLGRRGKTCHVDAEPEALREDRKARRFRRFGKLRSRKADFHEYENRCKRGAGACG